MPLIDNIHTIQLPDNAVVVVLVEHLGDILSCEPVVRYVKREYPNRPIAWVMRPHYIEALSGHPDLDYILQCANLYEATEWAKALAPSVKVIHLHPNGRKCSETKQAIENGNSLEVNSENYYDHGGLLAAFTHAAGLPKLTDAPQYYFPENSTPFEFQERYVVFHCKSNDIRRCWTRKHWLALYDFFAKQQIYVLEVGFTPIVDVTDAYYKDMTHERSIGQIAQIIKNAKYFVGVDSSFAHLANALFVEGTIVAGAYAKWDNYSPYSGFYQHGKMLQEANLPSWFMKPESVEKKYIAYADGKDEQGGSTGAVSGIIQKKPSFPNKWQKVVIRKLHRPLVKRCASAEQYACLIYYPEFYYAISDSPDCFFGLFYAIQKMFGAMPERKLDNPFS